MSSWDLLKDNVHSIAGHTIQALALEYNLGGCGLTRIRTTGSATHGVGPSPDEHLAALRLEMIDDESELVNSWLHGTIFGWHHCLTDKNDDLHSAPR